MMLRVLLGSAAVLSGLAALLYLAQDRMIYIPDRYPLDELREWARSAGVDAWPEGSAPGYRGLLSGHPASPVRGTVVVFHGNAGSARDRLFYRDALAPLGFRVLLAEYPGYGARKGRLGERSLVADARETVRLVSQRLGGPVFLWGESLGCGVASAVARDLGPAVAGVVLVTPWTDLRSLAAALYPSLPARRLVKDRYDNVANLAGFRGPVAVLAAERDEIIPSSHALRLFDQLPGPKRLWVFPGAGHNSWPYEPGRAWWSEAAGFVSPPPR